MRHYIYSFIISILFINLSYAQLKTITCINEKGEKICSIKAKSAYSFHNGMAEVNMVVLKDNKANYRSGFVDTTGRLVIPAIYDKAYAFYDKNVTWVRDPGSKEYYLINRKGEKINAPSWKKVGYFDEGLAAVYDENGKMGFVNTKGKLVIPCMYLGDSFSEGLACVMPYDAKVESYGFMDTTGKIVIPYQFKQAGTTTFQDGECRAVVNGVTCLINRKGEVVFKPTLTKNCMGFNNGLCPSYTNYNTRSNWGYYNRKNEWVIKPQYDNANSFIGGLAVVSKGKKEGVIDTTGKIIIPIEYDMIYCNPTEDGLFALEKIANGDKTYLKADGTPFTTLPVKYIQSHNGFAIHPYCDLDNKWGFLNRDGSVFIKAQFEHTNILEEGKSWIKGDASSLTIAKGVDISNFAKDYKVGDKVKAQKNGDGEFYDAEITQLGELYYLVKFNNNTQEWVTYYCIKE